MQSYLDLMRELLEHGELRPDRTGVGVYGLFARSLRYDLAQGFPLLTTKRVNFGSVVQELLWFLSGSTNAKELNERGVHIWDEWAEPASGDLGPIYGKQWRAWQAPEGKQIDQIANLLETLRTDEHSRRMVVCSWNVSSLSEMALPPCHCLFQMHVSGGRLSCQMYQRSADIFLGVPFNIASYALLTHMIAAVTGLEVGVYSHVFGDIHLYTNHVEQAREQLSRTPRPLPRLRLNPQVRDLFAFGADDIKVEGYDPHPAIRAPIAV